MKLSNLFKEELIELELSAGTKEDCIREMVDLMAESPYMTDKEIYLDAVMDREKLGSTGIGKGIAIPHGKTDSIKRLMIAFGRSKKGIDFDSLDDKKVHLVFLLAAPEKTGGKYLKTLAHLSRILREKEFRTQLINSDSKKELIDLLMGKE